MTDLEIMQRAKLYMDQLAQGIDPVTGQEVPEDSALNHIRLARCFAYVSGVLDKVIANGGAVGTIVRHKEFRITREQLYRVRLSDTPVSLTQLLEQIVAVVGDPEMKRPNAKRFSDWLLARGLLTVEQTPDGKTRRVPTQEGIRLGMVTQIRQGNDGEYVAVSYNRNAQCFLLDHLFEILNPEGR